ncbi:DUF998 domain-containing protein [Streptomyces sp. NPDC001606]
MKVRIGCWAWIAAVVQFFAVQAVVESAWSRPYSWARNNISDLGNAHCALQRQPEPRYVCSPDHALMNGSFAALGALLVVGAVLTGPLWHRSASALAARILLAGAGLGFLLAGLAPADVHENPHVLGALLIMGGGNIALLTAGPGLSATAVPHALRRTTPLLGLTGLTGLCLFLSHHYLGLGMGGMERVALFPLLVWALGAGAVGLTLLAPGRVEAADV